MPPITTRKSRLLLVFGAVLLPCCSGKRLKVSEGGSCLKGMAKYLGQFCGSR